MALQRSVKLLLPPIGYALVMAALLIAASRGQKAFKDVQFPLFLLGNGCVLASVIIVLRLFPRLRDRGVWVLFILNAIPILIVSVGLVCACVMYVIDLTNR